MPSARDSVAPPLGVVTKGEGAPGYVPQQVFSLCLAHSICPVTLINVLKTVPPQSKSPFLCLWTCAGFYTMVRISIFGRRHSTLACCGTTVVQWSTGWYFTDGYYLRYMVKIRFCPHYFNALLPTFRCFLLYRLSYFFQLPELYPWPVYTRS